jgi:hypothetical protein
METIDKIEMLHVFTTPQKPGDGQEIVEATARNGKNPDGTKREVAQENRLRCVVIPELSVDGVPSKFQMLVMSALRDLAAKQLATLWQDEPSIKEVPAAIWTVDSLLLFGAREAESKRLTKATLESWFDASDICKRLMAKGDAKLLAKWKADIVSLAAPSIAWVPDQCATVIATISKADCEEDNAIGQQLVAKLQKRIEDYAKQLAEVADEV